jgi:hypothetical protein
MKTMSSSPRRSNQPNDGTNASLGAFALSVIIHVSVLLLVGGYVVFQGVVPSTPFVAVDGMMGAPLDEVIMPEPVEAQEMPDVPSVSQEFSTDPAAAAEGESTSSDILVSTAPSLSFSLPPAVGTPSTLPKLGTGTGGSTPSGDAAAPAPASSGKILRSIFGSSEQNTNAMAGTFFDIGRDRTGKARSRDAAVALAAKLAEEIVKERGNPRVFREVFTAPVKLFASQFVFPRASTNDAYAAFGEKPVTEFAAFWVHYSAQVTPPEDGRYRFSAWGDDYVIVLVDGRPAVIADNMVFTGNPDRGKVKSTKGRFGWESPDDLFPLRYNQFARYTMGDWIDWKKGEVKRVDIFIGDAFGQFVALVGIDQEGKKHDKTRDGVPILPPFRVDKGRIDREEFKALFSEGVDFDAKGGPVFQVQ